MSVGIGEGRTVGHGDVIKKGKYLVCTVSNWVMAAELMHLQNCTSTDSEPYYTL